MRLCTDFKVRAFDDAMRGRGMQRIPYKQTHRKVLGQMVWILLVCVLRKEGAHPEHTRRCGRAPTARCGLGVGQKAWMLERTRTKVWGAWGAHARECVRCFTNLQKVCACVPALTVSCRAYHGVPRNRGVAGWVCHTQRLCDDCSSCRTMPCHAKESMLVPGAGVPEQWCGAGTAHTHCRPAARGECKPVQGSSPGPVGAVGLCDLRIQSHNFWPLGKPEQR